ncbi:MAG: class I SAM-dependent methyltransferase [Sphingomonadaceae bacterium]|nr:class I SAM-dependent methyltransferase [Sphingomonadaceae bacterium]
MNGFDPETLEFYAAEAATYVACRPDDVNPELPAFLELLPVGARILELGCGGGTDAEYMIAKGFDVELTDGVAEMAAQAEARLGRSVKVMRFDELDAVEAYDAVIACASLLHVPLEELTAILARTWRALKPAGWHLATYKTAGAQGRDEHGRYYNYLSGDEADRQYRKAGAWASINFRERAGIGYFSAPAQWLEVVAQKRA